MIIQRFQVSNFRSLANVNVGSLSRAAVFHGENNTDKSNILAALQAIFRPKYFTELAPSGETPPAPRVTPFYLGNLDLSQDDFRWGSNQPIEFSLTVEATQDEIERIEGMGPVVELVPAGAGHNYFINLVGQIRTSGDRALIQLEEGRLNRTVFYSLSSVGGVNYFPSLAGRISQEDSQSAAERLLLRLDQLFAVLESDRFLAKEPPGRTDLFTSPTFKRWLHGLSLSREHFAVYHSIQEAFRSAPFDFGEIGFSEGDDELEVMILDSLGAKRLPIGRLGTGVQQVLMLLARVIETKAEVVGIEELELNLSYKSQDLVLNKLKELIADPAFPLSQVLLTSHSDHIGSRGDVSRYHVAMVGGETQVRRFTSADRSALFPHIRGRRPFPPIV